MARRIRASEIGEYTYCHRAWWLRTIEQRSPGNQARLRQGMREHRRHGRRLVLSRALLVAGMLLLFVALLLGLLRP